MPLKSQTSIDITLLADKVALTLFGADFPMKTTCLDYSYDSDVLRRT